MAVKDLLDGNGTPERGIIIRLDRLEQDEKRRLWLIRCLIGSSVASVAAVIIEFITKH